MKVLFLTNMPAYHQIELADQLEKILGVGNFYLSVHARLNEERKQMRWDDGYEHEYLLRFSESEKDRQKTREWISSADVVIHGRFPIKHVRQRIKDGDLTFAYQERFWKKPKSLLRLLSRSLHLFKNYISVNRPNYHLLAAGYYAAGDLNRLGLFRERAWKFGYFIDARPWPEKPVAPIKLVWCGRMIALKQPEIALQAAAFLKQANIDFELTMIGGGELYDGVHDLRTEMGLIDQVKFKGWLSVSEVNKELQESHVLLMTSSHREGWGMVVNEAINNGCLAVVNKSVGSAQWLINNKESGITYDQNELEKMMQELVSLCAQTERLQAMAKTGHRRLTEQWSAKPAAQRLVKLSESLLADENAHDLFSSGPCSPT